MEQLAAALPDPVNWLKDNAATLISYFVNARYDKGLNQEQHKLLVARIVAVKAQVRAAWENSD